MATFPAELVIGISEKILTPVSIADTIVTAHNERHEKFVLVSDVAGLVASFVSMAKILAPISIQANTYAATVTFLKIVVEVEEGKAPQLGDVLSLIGSVSGIVASVAIMAETAPVWVPTVAAGIAITATGAGIFTGPNFDKLAEMTVNVTNNFWPTQPIPETTKDFYLDNTGNFRPFNEIPPNEFGAYRWDASSWGGYESIVTIQQPVHQGNDDPWIDDPY